MLKNRSNRDRVKEKKRSARDTYEIDDAEVRVCMREVRETAVLAQDIIRLTDDRNDGYD